jgi:hypothetical protein
MSIARWLLLAGLFGAAACHAAAGPNDVCTFIDRSDGASTGYMACPGQQPSP